MSSAANVLTAFSVLFGITLGVLAEFWLAFGNIQIKYSHKLDEESSHHRAVWKRCRWWIGFSMYVLNALFKFASYMFASLNIISPTSATSIIINAMLARWYLNEQLTSQGIIASILIIIGCVVSVIFGTHDQDSVTLDLLFKYADTARFISFTVIHVSLCIIVGIIGVFMIKQVDKMNSVRTRFHNIQQSVKSASNNPNIIIFNDEKQEQNEYQNEHISPLLDEVKTDISSKQEASSLVLTEKEKKEYMHILSCFCLVFTTSGLVAWVQMLGKLAADLLWQSIFEGNNQFTTFTPFIIVIVICIGLCLELYFISEIMRLFDAVLISPIYNSLFIFTSIAISAVFFRNFYSLSILNIILFTVGLLFIIWGMLLFVALGSYTT